MLPLLWRCALLSVLTATSIVSFASIGHAVPETSSRVPTAAEALFLSGRELMQRGDFAGALEKFRESQRLDPAVGTLFNLAECEKRMGLIATAWRHWLDAIALLPYSDAERLAFARGQASELERRVPRLTIQIEENTPKDAYVKIGGESLSQAQLGIPLSIDPGEVIIEVSAADREGSRTAVQLAEGERRTVIVGAGKTLAMPAVIPNVGASAATSSDHRELGWWLLGGAGVATVAGVVQAVLHFAVYQPKACPNGVCQSGPDNDKAQLLRVTGAITAGVAVAAGGLGSYFVFFSGDDASSGSSVTPVVEPGGAHLMWTGRF